MELTNYSQIRELLLRHGFRFSKSMGQNFLTAAWVPERIAEESSVGPENCVLEIGPGVGCLTRQLSQRAGKVVAIELDSALRPVLAETMADCGNVEIIFGDALKLDLAALMREKAGSLRPAVCANLPYNITSPLLSAFIEAKCFESITVMIQREVAQRLCAAAGSADYGAFTVYANWHAEPSILFDVSPGCFMPQPKVTSSVIRLLPRSAPPAEMPSEELFFRLVRAAFNQRRKTLVNALSSAQIADKAALERCMSECGLDVRVRGEALGIAQFVQLCEKISDL